MPHSVDPGLTTCTTDAARRGAEAPPPAFAWGRERRCVGDAGDREPLAREDQAWIREVVGRCDGPDADAVVRGNAPQRRSAADDVHGATCGRLCAGRRSRAAGGDPESLPGEDAVRIGEVIELDQPADREAMTAGNAGERVTGLHDDGRTGRDDGRGERGCEGDRDGDASEQSQALGSQWIGPPGGAIGRGPMLGVPSGGSRYAWGTSGVLPYRSVRIGIVSCALGSLAAVGAEGQNRL